MTGKLRVLGSIAERVTMVIAYTGSDEFTVIIAIVVLPPSTRLASTLSGSPRGQ